MYSLRERRKSRGIMDKGEEESFELQALNYPSAQKSVKVRRPRQIPLWTSSIIIVCLIFLFWISYLLFFRLPRGLVVSDEEKHPNAFIAEHASWYIGNLTKIGDRVAGHMNNEVYTVNYLLQEIDKIRFEAHTANFIEVDHQISNGSYWRDKPYYSSLNVYKGIQNVVVRLGTKDKTDSDHYILLNSHFDSVSMSPGKSAIVCHM